MDEILKILRKRQRVYIIHPDMYNKLFDWQKKLLEMQGKIFLCSCIEPTEMYVSTSEFSPNYPIEYWEEV